MTSTTKTCRLTGKEFIVYDDEQKFCEQMEVPLPDICPEERMRRLMAERNARSLYYRKCDFSGKTILSQHHPNTTFPVYETSEWWSDKWDGLDYGMDFDFSRPFFEQFLELKNKVPHMSVYVIGGTMENSDFTNCAAYLKNCYLISESDYDEDCYFSNRLYHSKDIVDCSNGNKNELCYEITNCKNCYNVDFSRYSSNCSDSSFLLNCRGCKNCFGCVNLNQKQYHIFNKPHSPEEYRRIVKSYELNKYSNLVKFRDEVEGFFKNFPRKYINGTMNENATGDSLYNCKDSFECYDSANLRDCKYCVSLIMGANDCHDLTTWGENTTRVFNTAGAGGGAQNIVASFYCGINSSDVSHSFNCMNGNEYLFGCASLKHKKYCILNKQYSEEEYFELRDRIIEHMTASRSEAFPGESHASARPEYGEFFPPNLSPFGYNETMAIEHYPLARKQALDRGFKWKEPDPKEYLPQIYEVPDMIEDVPDSICQKILACTCCNKNFKVIPQELRLYRKKNLPIPRRCPNCRHLDRLKLRNPRKLWNRKCSACDVEIKTSYSPDREETVLCEKCYLAEVY